MFKFKNALIIVLILTLSGSCIKGDYYLKMTPDMVVTDCCEKTLNFTADPCLDSGFKLLPDKTDTDTYDQFWKEDETRSRRCIVGDWFHIAAVSSFEIEVHLDENTSSESRGIAIHVDSGKVDVRCSVIIQEGKK